MNDGTGEWWSKKGSGRRKVERDEAVAEAEAIEGERIKIGAGSVEDADKR